MKFNFLYLILGVLFGIFVFFLFMQKEHNTKELVSQIDSVKERLTVLEIPPQTGEDAEKIKLATQLADANTKLINAGFGKFERELRDSNYEWMWKWTGFFVGIIAVIGVALWFVVKSMIADRVEERLNGFKEAVDKVSILEGQIKILEKEHAISLLEDVNIPRLIELERYPRQTKALREEVLLEVFSDKTCDLGIRWTAVNVLGARKSPRLVSPVLNYLNSVVDSDIDWGISRATDRYPYLFLSRLSDIHNEETYQGLKNFLNRMIKENPKNKNIFLPWTVFSLAHLGIELDIKDSIDMLREVIPDLKEIEQDEIELITLAKYFDKFKEHEGIKEILTNDLTEGMPDVETRCLELLPKRYSNFVKDWKEKKETTNTESEES